ncbi:selenocysteine-specific translation elongation factor [Cetobacterium sp. ZWU0022]|uniref:selenocysteine-specific translation elongation factor n=1 Tax=Cetobacterium sp. ZWU0022 TaxID=1340502 RepID=UPI0006460138|nr:selenocysteine-specific translation elongation factor [Cetobacterium sp. ZWU0022]
MRNWVIGTAGHIDHGKTTLVKMLTDIDTDNSKEEKERGMTIDLGFAPLLTPDGKTISIIDVPGHEKFIKNMVAGAKGIDFVLFLIAADDGIMPQTIEHKEILKLLGVEHGIIVLSKRDLVNDSRVSELKAEISQTFSDGYFNNFPIIEVSSKDSQTFKTLYNLIISELSLFETSKQSTSESSDFFRLDIDKIYSPKGIGTIVSGTSIGNIRKGDILTIFPQGQKVKIKGIQVHGKDVEQVFSHQRCALNISNINAKDVKRGAILSNGSIIYTKILDVLFSKIYNGETPKNNTKIRLNIGTAEYYGKLKYLKDEYSDSIFFQLIMDEYICVDFDDIGILRSLSQSTLLGSIRILNPNAVPTKKNNLKYLKKLNYFLNKKINFSEYLLDEGFFVSIQSLKKEFNLKEIDLSKEKDILLFHDEDLLIHKNNFEKIKSNISLYLENFHKQNPLSLGVSSATINSIFFNNLNIIKLFPEYFKEVNGFVSLESFKVKLSKDEKNMKDEIYSILKKEKFNGINKNKLNDLFKNKLFKDIFIYLLKNNFIIEIGEIFILNGFYKEALTQLNLFFNNNDKITLAQFKDLLGCSRKIALIYLEEFDHNKITKKIDDYRVLL